MHKYQNELNLLMNDILNVTKNINLKIWLEAGTILGCLRDNDYIPWKNDIDFGSWSHLLKLNKYQKFKRMMVIKGYTISKSENVITIKKLGFKCHADINFYRKIYNKAVRPFKAPISKSGRMVYRLFNLFNSKNIFKTLQFHKISFNKILYFIIYYLFKFFIPAKFKKKILYLLKKSIKKKSVDLSWKIPFKFLNKTKKIKFKNFYVFIPHKASDYMKFRYGKNWKTPRSNWNQFTEDKSIALVQKND